MEPDRVDGGQPARLARFVHRVLEPGHLHFVLQFHPRARALARVRFVRQPDFDVAAARAQRRRARQRAERLARQIPARRLRRFDAHAEFLDQRSRDAEQRARVVVGQFQRRGVDQHQMVVRDPHMHGLHAGPRRVTRIAAVGEQHVRRERRLVGRGRSRGHRAEAARDPALVRQRALEVLADHALDERRAGDQFVESPDVEGMQRGGGIGRGGQREGQEEVQSVGVHDAAHCMANFAPLIRDGGERKRRLVRQCVRFAQ
ncbi:conserved hypothetical protein [Paraburkholderia piptadeniae]|uniref:Uncharacterized protein n=1 Tax=Paraburkholderia piptadeniae TaxID=1701573 RepID=A0A1N7S5R6_9BURK|nr:conserved hypothetical protein [Paraburkholderia piptadeniae]